MAITYLYLHVYLPCRRTRLWYSPLVLGTGRIHNLVSVHTLGGMRINSLPCADDTTLLADNEEDLKIYIEYSLWSLMDVRAGLSEKKKEKSETFEIRA
ncbi:hypothetical protein LAZ67_16000143 [Cordylochernes scorpioides]|uniref:Uncharacterized protein n=1 Tax=Cordylochernes scorpioides TaxID=51811 RepID=A0ABY6LBL2_9ARAC|nr:hypothetical protein LAZ67_16000143 [Cordylochernes scorpioides]